MNIYENHDLAALLAANTYPGRGIVLGKTADGKESVVAYFIMGRSQNSRNRVFVKEPGRHPHRSPRRAKMADPSLIIYHPVRQLGRASSSLMGTRPIPSGTACWRGESPSSRPCAPGHLSPTAPTIPPASPAWWDQDGSFCLSILKSADGDPTCCCRYL